MSLKDFTYAYIETALWSSNDESDDSGGEPFDKNYDASDIAPETRKQMEDDCAKFYRKMAKIIDSACAKDTKGRCDDTLAGHDFWLTRCGHGAGFWDGDWPEPEEKLLTMESKRFGNYDLYLGDDGQIYGSKG